MTAVFIDSNVPMYVAGKDHPNREPSRRFMARVHAGEFEACTSTEVLQEILYRYAAIGRRDLARSVYDLFLELCPTVLPVSVADTDRARDLCCGHLTIGARDSVHAAVMLNHGLERIASFDRGFDRVPGIERFDPA